MERTPNGLADAASPYLLQHARNPVDWWPWCDEAFAEAARRDCPVFLSIGYATCHWCHVMERESFEDAEVAACLNQAFVCVKVDREERPDVDSAMMAACLALNESGGWPLTILLTPEGRPFFAATYLPPRSRGGRAGLLELTARVAELWSAQRPALENQARELGDWLRAEMERAVEGDPAPRRLLEDGLARLAANHDGRHGGFGQAPKFPVPQNLLLLIRSGRLGDATHAEMARGSLLAMVRGGLFDQLGGGFHRYSTDERWLVPHFEKMLYDQAGMALALVEAIEDPRCPAEEREELDDALAATLEYLLRVLRLPCGAFACGEDADSEGEEGRFYVWTLEELRALLPPEDVVLAQRAWQILEEGNWREEAGGRQTGSNILHAVGGPARRAGQAGLPPAEWRSRLAEIRETLLRVRAQRARPLLDDKVLTDWNGLAIAALARAAASSIAGTPAGRELWRQAAVKASRFILEELEDGGGVLLHRWHRGRGGVPGLLDDHAFLIWGLLELAAMPGGGMWLEAARGLQGRQDEGFWDEELSLYRMTSDRMDEQLPGGMRPLETRDGALPCGNSVSLHNLRRLACLLDDTAMEERAERLERALRARAVREPGGHGWTLAAIQDQLAGRRRLVMAGPAGDPRLEELGERTGALRRPGLEVLRLDPDQVRQLGLPDDGHAVAAWLCDERGCRPPVHDAASLDALLG